MSSLRRSAHRACVVRTYHCTSSPQFQALHKLRLCFESLDRKPPVQIEFVQDFLAAA